ncbi:MAG: siphovirus Gp157 family protein [Hyphomicrobiaceae bacterium]
MRSRIPSEFWKPQPPRLDKKVVLDALKAGAVVPGAELSNGGETLSMRVK